MKVLVTGARLPMAREIARALKELGAVVIVSDSLALPYTRFSRYADGYIRTPAPALDFSAFRASILEGISREAINLIVPVNEEIFFLSRFRDEIEKTTALFNPPFRQLQSLHSKWHYRALVEGCGADAPVSLLAEDNPRLQSAIKEIPDCVIKPEFSRGAFHTLLAPTAEQVADQRVLPSNPLVVQQRVAGKEFCTYSVMRAGKLFAHTCYHPLYRAGQGAGVYFAPVRHSGILSFVTAFGAKNAFTGQVAFDIIEDSAGRLYTIECNPRTTAGVHLLGGVKGWGAVFTGSDMVMKEGALHRPRMAGAATLFLCAKKEYKAGRSGAFLKNLMRARDVMFDWTDPLPFLSQTLATVELAGLARRNGRTMAEAYNFGLEWDGD